MSKLTKLRLWPAMLTERVGAAESLKRLKCPRQFISSTCHIWHREWQPPLQGDACSRAEGMWEARPSHFNKEGRETEMRYYGSTRPPHCQRCLLLTSTHRVHFLGFHVWLAVLPLPHACLHTAHVLLNFEQQCDRWLYSDWDFVFPGLFLYLLWLHFPLEICVLGIDLALEELSIWICLTVKCCLEFKAIAVHNEEQTWGCGFLVQRLHQPLGLRRTQEACGL